MIDSNLGICKYYLQVMKFADKQTNTWEEQLKIPYSSASMPLFLSNSLALPENTYSTQYDNKKRAYHSFKYFHV